MLPDTLYQFCVFVLAVLSQVSDQWRYNILKRHLYNASPWKAIAVSYGFYQKRCFKRIIFQFLFAFKYVILVM